MGKLAGRYTALTFIIMVIGWGSCVVCSLCGLSLSQTPILYIPYLLGGLSPTIASYFAQKKTGKVQSLKGWLAVTFDWKRNLVSYCLIPVLAGIFFLCLCSVCGYQPGAPLFSLVFMVPMMLFGGGLEEAGWRSVLQPELEKKLGYSVATVLVALIWWVWHLPLFFINGVSQYGADFMAFGLNVLGLSFALAAIKHVTRSTFLCVLFHCLINSLHGVFLVEENIAGNGIAAAVLIVFSYIILFVHKKTQLFSCKNH